MILRGTVFSTVLEMDTGITIVTPSDCHSEEPYKVAYLLHGLCGNNDAWADDSMLPVHAREGHTIYVMPDAGRGFYTDMRFGPRYFTYIVDELPVICKSVFRISAKREDTAILGASMGGYGALKCALTRPEQYGMCGAFSSACLFLREGLEEQREHGGDPVFIRRYGERLLADFEAIFGRNLDWKPEYEILELAKRIKDRTDKPAVYMACGSNDPFRASHVRFQKEMRPLGFDLLYEEWKGIHDFFFFDESLRRAIRRFSL